MNIQEQRACRTNGTNGLESSATGPRPLTRRAAKIYGAASMYFGRLSSDKHQYHTFINTKYTPSRHDDLKDLLFDRCTVRKLVSP